MTDVDRRTTLKLIGAGAGAIALNGAAGWNRARAVPNPAPPSGPAGKTLSEKIADYIVAAKFEDLPPAVVRKAKEQIAYFFGRAFEISFLELPRQVRQLAQELQVEGPGASVIGERLNLSVSDAAFANSTLFGASYGIDDSFHPSGVHASAVTLPAALAIGEVQRVSGRELLLALVLGYEVIGKVGGARDAAYTPLARRGTHVFGGYGPVVAAGRLLGLDRVQMANALGYAANLCMGITEGGMMDYYYSLISRNGTLAAQLAQVGATAYSRATLEGETGLYRSFFGEIPAEAPPLIDTLGKQWETLNITQKRWPGSGQTLSCVQLFVEMVREEKLTVAGVSKIEAVLPMRRDVRADEIALRGPFNNRVDARGSLPNLLAIALVDGRVGIARFENPGLINDDKVARVIPKIDVAFEDGHPSRWTRLIVHTADGRRLERTRDTYAFEFPRAVWGEWLGASGSRILSAEQLAELEQLLGNLEELDDVSKLMKASTPAAARSA